ncbi:hypothetical protein JW711_06035 [Candidatus Woesearchaeota archaeon]|nr:hypothetical protein [Candidatus Woesearchaeota archaeon]
MNKRLSWFLVLLMVLLQVVSLATAQNDTCIYFFYGQGCQHCAKVAPFIEQLAAQHNELDVHTFEVYGDRENLVLLNEFFESYNIPDQDRGVPVVFIADHYLVGDAPILQNLEGLMAQYEGAPCPLKMEEKASTGETGDKSPTERLGTLSIITVISAALVDSINPCAIAVLLILMSALVAAGDKRRALYAGLAFTLSIYIAYFLFGLGLFSALQISGLSYWFYKAIGFLAIIIGLANIKDYFWYGGGGFVMEIPRAWRPTLKRMLGAVTSPLGAFIMGFAVCLFELPCTGGPYIFILGLLAEKTTMMASIPILLLYNLFFVLPLLVITALIYTGFSSTEKANEWKDKNIRILHLAAGLVMLVLGLLVVLGVV